MADTTRRPFVDNTIKPLEPNPKHASFIIFEPVMYDPRDEETIQGFGKILQIPVMPESLTITQDANHNEEQSLMIGGVLERNAPTLRQFSIDTFLPRSLIMGKDWGGRMFYNTAPLGEHGETGLEWKFIQKRFIDYIQFLMKRRMILDYTMILTPTDRHRQENFYVCIKHFEYTFNPHDDLDYRLDLIEWREPKIRLTREETTDEGTPDTPNKPPRTPSRGDGKILLVMHDNPWYSKIPQLLVSDSVAGAKYIRIDGDPVFPVLNVYDKSRNMTEIVENVLLGHVTLTDIKPSELQTKYGAIHPHPHTTPKFTAANPSAYSTKIYDAIGKINKQPYSWGVGTIFRMKTPNPMDIGKVLAKELSRGEKEVESNFVRAIIDIIRRTREAASGALMPVKVIKYYDGGNLIGLDTVKSENGQWITQVEKGSAKPVLGVLSYGGTGYNGNMTGAEWLYGQDGESPLYMEHADTSGKSKSVNTITIQTGKLPYDDLVRRVQTMDVPRYALVVKISKQPVEVDVRDITTPPDQFGGDVFIECSYKLTVGLEQYGTEKWSLIETVGTRYHRGQRFAVPDTALRSPTKEEVSFDKERGSLNRIQGRP